MDNIGATIIWSKILEEFKHQNCPDEISITNSDEKNQALVSDRCTHSDFCASINEKSFISEFNDLIAFYVSKISPQINFQGKMLDETRVVTNDLVVVVNIQDFDWWYNGFRKHGYSKTGPWGFLVSNVRQDYCDDASTCVYRGIVAQNEVVVCLFNVDIDVYKNFNRHASCRRLKSTLGENDKTAVTKLMKPYDNLRSD